MLSTVSVPGGSMPISVKRERLISRTSTSSTTSGSGRSWAAISFSASRTAAGVSRIVRLLSFSSAYRSRVRSTVLSIDWTLFTSALPRKKVLTISSE